MGMSTIITHVILFIAVISIATGLLMGIKNFADQSESAFNTKKDDFNRQIGTDISIEVVHYNNETNQTSVFVRNTGQTIMKPAQIDVYIDGLRIPRNDTNRTIMVLSDTDTVDVGNWNPKEELKIVVKLWLNENKMHSVIVTTPYETTDTETFSVD
jgi:archaellum component FlaF (FlaF/FlaG flagellin family)